MENSLIIPAAFIGVVIIVSAAIFGGADEGNAGASDRWATPNIAADIMMTTPINAAGIIREFSIRALLFLLIL